jgi:hypothetical protein
MDRLGCGLEVRVTGASRRPLAGTRRSPAGIPECQTRRALVYGPRDSGWAVVDRAGGYVLGGETSSRSHVGRTAGFAASGPVPWPEVFLLHDPQITQLPEPAVMRPMGHSFASGGWFERVRANRWACRGRPQDVGNRTVGPGSRVSSQTAQGAGQPRVVDAKLMLPRVQARRLRRTRSLEMLDDDGASMLTAVLDAGAGDGEAMLLRSWCTEHPESMLWMTLDAGNDDLVRCGCTLATAVDFRHDQG